MSYPNTRIAPINNWGTLQASFLAAAYVALADVSANSVTIRNDTGVTVAIRRAGTTESPYLLPTANSASFALIGTTKELELKRNDATATEVTVSAAWVK